MSDRLADSYAFCRRFARRTAKNFYYSFFGLPRDRFDAMCVLYSYMRICDDIGDDERSSVPARLAALDLWEADVRQVFSQPAETGPPASRHHVSGSQRDPGGPRVSGKNSCVSRESPCDFRESVSPGQRPHGEIPDGETSGRSAATDAVTTGRRVLPALTAMIARFQIPHAYFFEVLAGVRADLEADRHRHDHNDMAPRCRFTTFDELADYCYRVAGVVGQCCVHIWGFSNPRALDLAVDCGLAFQLTNILRDLAEDADNGRVYLPADELQRFNYQPRDILHRIRDQRFQQLMTFQVDRVAACYDRAAELFAYLDPVGQPVLSAMIRIYGGLLTRIERQHFDVYSQRIALPVWRKLLIAADALVRRRPGPPRLRRQRPEPETPFRSETGTP